MTSRIPETDFTRDVPPKVPGVSRRVQCGHYIGAGVTSYRCELGIGHDETPAEDPEPHYSVSVQRTVLAWQQWAKREWEREQNPMVTLVTEDDEVVCPAGVVGCDLTFPHSHGTTDEAGHPDHEQIFIDGAVSEISAESEFQRGWDAAVARVETLCAEWDKVTKGQSPTTATIRALFEVDLDRLRSIVTRDDLVREVTEVVNAAQDPEWNGYPVDEVVDRIMGWVTAKIAEKE